MEPVVALVLLDEVVVDADRTTRARAPPAARRLSPLSLKGLAGKHLLTYLLTYLPTYLLTVLLS